MKRLDNQRLLPVLVFTMGLAVTFLTWNATRQDTLDQLREEFNAHVSQINDKIEKRYQDSRMILRGVSGLFYASNEVTRAEFDTYVDSLQIDTYYPGIKSIGLGMLVRAAQKADFVRQQRQDGQPEFDIWPAVERDFSVPVMYRKSSADQQQPAFGFDLYSEPMRRDAMQIARDSGKISMTGKITLLSKTDEEPPIGILMYAPVYRNSVPHGTLEQRQANIIGWVYLSFRLDSMMGGVLGNRLNDLNEQIDFHIYDGDTASDETSLYHSHPIDDTAKRTPLFESTMQLSLANRKWLLVVHSRPAFEARQLDFRQMTVIGIGALVSLLLAFIVWQQVNARQRVIRLARRMNHDLIEREQRYRQMFEDNVSMAYLTDPATGNIIDASGATVRFWGYTQEELRGMNIADINTTPLAQLLEHFGQIISNGSMHLYCRHRLKNGNVRDVEVFANPLRYQNRTCIYSIMHDITDRQRAQNALRNGQERLRAIIDTAMDSVVQIDANGVIIDWSLQAEKTFGWSRQEAIGKELLGTVIPTRLHDEYRSSLKRFLENEDSPVRHSRFEIIGLHKDGHEFPIEVAITTMIGNDGQPEICAFIHDISNRQRNEHALRKARNELENRVFERTAELVRSNKRLNQEIADRTHAQEALQQSQEMLRELVAHQDRIRETERKRIAREIHDELGQHLLVLRIDVSMLSREGDGSETAKLQQQVEAILQHIDTTMKSVRAIINNLRPSVLDLGLFAALEWQAKEFQRRSGIECELLAEDENMELDDNTATVLFRILQEALNNVLKHARASRVRIELRYEKNHLVMKIADNGIGMPQTRNRERKSFGLAGIRERTSILGGTMHIDSSGNGTVLVVSLPLEKDITP
ncbi:MAG: CHASE domain-containing protein [Burkholderiaceae bacterium]|nr:CHASE domain-containing protein [Burkholderiaceae bacterium]